MPGKIILEMRHICKKFPGVVALDDVNFQLYEGEVHVLLGENGAGKSTLIKIISGAYSKDSGAMILEGIPADIQSPGHALELGIGTIYQELNLVSQLTVAENIFLGREPVNKLGIIDSRQVIRNARNVLAALKVEIDPQARVVDLGIAQQQIVEILKAISMQMKILILDEPTSALTCQEIEKLFETIRQLKEKGVGIIYISHRIEEIFEIGDRVTVLRDGRVVRTCSIDAVDSSDLIRLMVARELKEHFPKRKAMIGAEALRVEHLTRTDILDDINFVLQKGEILGITGLMGSGRTELARAIFGVDGIDSGNIYINGKKWVIDSPRKAIEAGLGYMTEDRKLQGLIFKLSVGKNISLASLDRVSNLGIIMTESEQQLAKRFIQELQIKTTGPDQLVQSLSGGNQQKVVIAKWLACQSDIFIFDEPTRGIDVAAKVEIYQLMNTLTARGAAIIMISSELPEVIGMSDRILVMCHGRINGEFDPSNILQEELLKCGLGI